MHRAFARSSPLARRGSPRRRSRPRSTPTPPPKQKWSFAGPFGKFDRGAAAARLQGLPRGLPGLSRPVAASRSATSPSPAVPASPTAQVGGDRRRIQGQGRPERPGRDVRAPRPAGRPFPVAVPERAGGARAPMAARAAGPVGDRQGARLRARLPVVPARHRSPSTRSRAPDYIAALLHGLRGQAAGRLHAAGGHLLQQVFPRPRHRRCRRR